MELNYWTSTEFEGGSYDESAQRWTVTLNRAGEKRVMHPRHVVMATGVSGIPNIPDIPALKGFRGQVIHSSEYGDAAPWKGRTCSSSARARARTISRRTSTAAAPRSRSCRGARRSSSCDRARSSLYSLYSEGPPLEDCDLITASVPLTVARRTHQLATRHAKELDRELLERLEKKGFRLTDGPDGTGWQFLYLTRGGGYYFNVGCSELIVEGKVGLAQYAELEKLLPDADLVVLPPATKGKRSWCAGYSARKSRRASARSGASAKDRSCATCSRARPAGPVVHRRQLRAVPHLFQVSALQIQARELGLI